MTEYTSLENIWHERVAGSWLVNGLVNLAPEFRIVCFGAHGDLVGNYCGLFKGTFDMLRQSHELVIGVILHS